MKAAVLESPDGPDALNIADLPDPEPQHGEVLVKMRAASVNFRDTLILKGAYRKQQKAENLIPLSDGAGEVVAVGGGVDEFEVGDRVAAMFFRDWLAGEPDVRTIKSDWGRDTDGMLCELKVFKPHNLARIPEYLSFEEAATLPCAALTAWSALVTEGNIKPGDLVLTQGTGGVSLFALQFAKMAGAEVFVTSSSDEKLAKASDMGADDLINYRDNPDWGEIALALSNDEGVDNVIEVGGTETLKQSLIAVRPGGTLSLIGVLSGATAGNVLLPYIVQRKVALRGITVGHREGFKEMVAAMALRELRPVIDRVFPFADLAEAFRYLQSAAHFGKVCISI